MEVEVKEVYGVSGSFKSELGICTFSSVWPEYPYPTFRQGSCDALTSAGARYYRANHRARDDDHVHLALSSYGDLT